MAQHEAIDRWDDLLNRERTLILRGDIAGLARLDGERAGLRAALSAMPVAAIANLRAKAERNQRLLEAAAAGIRSAIARLGDIRTVASQFDSYSASGNRTSVAIGPARVERRA